MHWKFHIFSFYSKEIPRTKCRCKKRPFFFPFVPSFGHNFISFVNLEYHPSWQESNQFFFLISSIWVDTFLILCDLLFGSSGIRFPSVCLLIRSLTQINLYCTICSHYLNRKQNHCQWFYLSFRINCVSTQCGNNNIPKKKWTK